MMLEWATNKNSSVVAVPDFQPKVEEEAIAEKNSYRRYRGGRNKNTSCQRKRNKKDR